MKEGLKIIGANAFLRCTKLKEIVIPSTVEMIGVCAFNYCNALENVVIKTNKITEIWDGTFEHCESLQCIEIPSSVTIFHDDAFGYCTNLREMRIDVNVNKEDKNPVTAIMLDEEEREYPFWNVPTDRKLVFLNSDGTKELAGTSLLAAQKAYMEADDGNTADNLWWKWKIGDLADLYTVTVEVEKDGEKWEEHGKKFFLKNESGYLIDDFQAESGTYTVCVDIGNTVIDTGVTVLVEDSDTSVTIEYFTVTFYDGDVAYGNDTAWGQQIVRKQDYAIKPASEPSKDDFKFAGWKTDKEGSEAFNFEAGITEATDIYASWIKDSESSATPSKPTETETPTTSDEPTESETPTTPSKPTESEAPTNPNEPTELETPSIPTVPSNPSETETTTIPNNPAESETTTTTTKPSNPAESEPTTTPSSPANTEPNKPINSGTPSNPNTSENPNEFSGIEETGTTAPVSEAQKGEKPKTGDTTRVEIYATAAMIAGLSYVMLMFARRKEGMSEEEKNIRVSALIEWSKKGSRVRRYIALVLIFFILLHYHSIGKRLDLQWKEICGN